MLQAVSRSAVRYDRATVAAHWLTAILVVAQWCTAHMIDWAPRGAPRVPMRSVHLTLGVLLAVLIVARIVWRLTKGRRLPAADGPALHAVAKATHYALYALVVATVTFGLALWWYRGDSWFFVFSTPAPNPADKGVHDFFDDWHPTLANAALILAGVHASAALIHRFLWRDGVLARMGWGATR